MSWRLLIRWLVWLLLVSFESVVGFPWLSMLLLGEWLLVADDQALVASLLGLSLILAASYSLSWVIALLIVMVIWRVSRQTPKNSWWRWVVYLLGALVVGIIKHLPLNALSLIFTLLSLVILLRVLGVKPLRKLWQRPSMPSVG